VVSTFAGTDEEGSRNHPSDPKMARFKNPRDVAVDSKSGNIYVADGGNQLIRKITPAGAVSTLAGQSGTAGDDNDIGAAAQFRFPAGIAVDSRDGNIYVADRNNHLIRKIIISTGAVSTLAGQSGTAGDDNGIGAAAQFRLPSGIAVGSRDGNIEIYVADQVNHRIRKITPAGEVSDLAGQSGTTGGYADGAGAAAQFDDPTGIAVDSKSGNIYVADSHNHCIRKIIASTGEVSTLAGSTENYHGDADGTAQDARFFNPIDVAVDSKSGDIYVADQGNHRIRKITPAGVVSTLAGSTGGYADGIGAAARFDNPAGIAVDSKSGNIYVADRGNHRIRKIEYRAAP